MRYIFLIVLCSLFSFELSAQQSLKIIPFATKNVKVSNRHKKYFKQTKIARDSVSLLFTEYLKEGLEKKYVTTILSLTDEQKFMLANSKRKNSIVPLLPVDRKPEARKKFVRALQDKYPRQNICYFDLQSGNDILSKVDTANEMCLLLHYYRIKNKGAFNLAFRNRTNMEVSYTFYKPHSVAHTYKVVFPANFQKDMYASVFSQYNKIVANKLAERVLEYKNKDSVFVPQRTFSMGIRANGGLSYMAQKYLITNFTVDESGKLLQESYSGGLFFHYSVKPNSWLGLDINYLRLNGAENTKFVLYDSTLLVKSGVSNDKIQRSLTCLTLPVYYMHQFGKLKSGLGLQLNYILNASTVLTENKAAVGTSPMRSIYLNGTSLYKKYDIGGQAFLSWDLTKRIFVDVKYYYGIFNNSTNGFVKIRNQNLLIGFGFKLL